MFHRPRGRLSQHLKRASVNKESCPQNPQSDLTVFLHPPSLDFTGFRRRFPALAVCTVIACIHSFIAESSCRMFQLSICVFMFVLFTFNAHAFIVPMFDNDQVQPGCYNPPAIPHNLTTRPQGWRDAPSVPPLVTRQAGKAWPGWRDLQYLFTLCVSYLGLTAMG